MHNPKTIAAYELLVGSEVTPLPTIYQQRCELLPCLERFPGFLVETILKFENRIVFLQDLDQLCELVSLRIYQ